MTVFLAGVGVGFVVAALYVLALALVVTAARADRAAAHERAERLAWERAMRALTGIGEQP